MTWTKQRHRLSILLIVVGLALGMVSVSHAQRFVRPINSIPELVASNPNDPHTNVFIPQGPTGPGLFYQWRKNDGTTTNSNLSVLGTDWPGASGRWHNIPIAQGSITGISNSGTNGFAVVNTLADLKNIPGNLGIGMVYIRGHSQAYDWGQGFFSRVDDCSVPDDDGLTSVHGNDALTCWTRENRFPWSGTPVQYAGGTVTRTIINTVSEHLSTQGGGTVIITDGSWDIDTSNGPILGHSNVSIVGMASALLVGDGVGDMFNWTNINNAAILQIGISNVVNGVVLRGATNVLIGGNPISDVGDGVLQYGGDNVRIEHNIFSVVTNGVHFSLDGAVKVTGGSLIGNTFSGMLGSNVLEDAGATDGYRQFDSGTILKLTQLLSAIQMGTNVVLRVGTGTPEGVVTADPSSIFLRRDTGDVYRKASGTGNTGWVLNTGAVTGPAGSDTQVQFNDGGVFGADVDFTWDKINNQLTVQKDGDSTITIPLKLINNALDTGSNNGIQMDYILASTVAQNIVAGSLRIEKSQPWTGTASTRDSQFNLFLRRDGSSVSIFLVNSAGDTKISGSLILTPSSLQSLAAGTALTLNAGKIRVEGSGGAVTCTATPSIADGTDGQIVYILGTSDVNTWTIQDQGGLGSSNIELGAATRVLGKGDILCLMFDTTDSVWYEVSVSNN